MSAFQTVFFGVYVQGSAIYHYGSATQSVSIARVIP